MNTLITGASSGIGEALALACSRRGDRLFLCGRDCGRLKAVAAACRELRAAATTDAAAEPDGGVQARVVDVTDEAAVRKWIEDCETVAPLERVISNAGVSTGEETEENSRRTFAINVGGCLNVVHPAIEIFRRRGKDDALPRQILITASVAGYGPLKACPAYSATKACVKTWGLALRGQLAPENIRVNVICPGFVKSRLTDRNTCPMPFIMPAEKAARIILARADRNVGLIAFPWPMRLATWWLSVLPWRLNELINRLLPRKVI